MKPINDFSQPIQILFTDIDDTLTWQGQLPSESYEMLWRLHKHGIHIIPVTGRPAGWCEMISRMWPVRAVIGENGAFYFQYADKKMQRTFAIEEKTRQKNKQKLIQIKQQILKDVPGAALASDQFTRLFDLAIDFCEDVASLGESEVQKITQIFKDHGATAKVSSIHVNGWFGDYDKKSMCETFYQNEFGKNLSQNLNEVAFIGDSLNDEPLFGFFENSVAVANILKFKDQLQSLPTYVTEQEGAMGFVEFGERLLSSSKPKF